MTPRLEFTPEVESAYHACEERLAGLRTPFLNAARRLDDPHRRRAFCAAYLSVRMRGPACLPAPVGAASSSEQSRYLLRDWRDRARLCHLGQPDPRDPEQTALADAMARFGLPMTPWLRLEEGLRAIALGEPVPDLAAFVTRARLLGGAQAWIFLRVLVARTGARRYCVPDDLNVEELAHDPGVFAFIVRKLLDVFRELDWWTPRRTSLPEDVLGRHRLGVEPLLGMRRLSQAPREFHEMMNDLAHVAWRFYENGVAKLAQAAANLSPDAVARVDRNLDGYKKALRAMELLHFSPTGIESLNGERDGRLADIGAGPEARTEASERDRPGAR